MWSCPVSGQTVPNRAVCSLSQCQMSCLIWEESVCCRGGTLPTCSTARSAACLWPSSGRVELASSPLPLPFLTPSSPHRERQPGRIHTNPQQTHLGCPAQPSAVLPPSLEAEAVIAGPSLPCPIDHSRTQTAVKSRAGPHAHPGTLCLAAEAGSGSGVPEGASIVTLWLSSKEGLLVGGLATFLLSCSACP